MSARELTKLEWMAGQVAGGVIARDESLGVHGATPSDAALGSLARRIVRIAEQVLARCDEVRQIDEETAVLLRPFPPAPESVVE